MFPLWNSALFDVTENLAKLHSVGQITLIIAFTLIISHSNRLHNKKKFESYEMIIHGTKNKTPAKHRDIFRCKTFMLQPDFEPTWFEPTTSCLQGGHTTNWVTVSKIPI